MYRGSPSIRFEGDSKEAITHISEGKSLLESVQNIKDEMGVGTFAMTQWINDHTYAYALSSMTNDIIFISCKPAVIDIPVPTPEIPPPGPGYFSLYSGLIFGGVMDSEYRVVNEMGQQQLEQVSVCRDFAPTPITTRMNNQETLRAGIRQTSTRLAVSYADEMAQYLGDQDGLVELTQYGKLRSSLYSGAMAEVVQILMGIGKLPTGAFAPDTYLPPGSYFDKAETAGIQVQYDWHFQRCHGAVHAQDGSWWLVEISGNRGIIAMPLPMIPGTDDETGTLRAEAESRGDSMVLAALDRFGAIPSGEPFPDGDDLTTAIQKGDVLRFMDASSVQDLLGEPYSTDCGFSFSSEGDSCVNTSYDWDAGNFMYARYLVGNFSITGLNKDRRDGEPVGWGSGSIWLEQRNIIHSIGKGKLGRYINFKIYEPLVDGLISVDAAPADGAPANPGCDAIVLAAYQGTALKTIHWYCPKSTSTSTNSDNEGSVPESGDCSWMNGIFTTVTNSGGRTKPAMIYCTGHDDRGVYDAVVTQVDYANSSAGLGHWGFTDFANCPDEGAVYRNQYFKHYVHTQSSSGETAIAECVAPQYARDSFYYVLGTAQTTESESESVSYSSITTNGMGYLKRCWVTFGEECLPKGCGLQNCCGADFACLYEWQPATWKECKERRVVCVDSTPDSDCGVIDSATPGRCAVVDSYNDVPAPTYTGYTKTSPGHTTLVGKGWFISKGAENKIIVSYGDIADEWTAPSPNPDSMYFQSMTAETSAIGDELAIYSTALNNYAMAHKGYSPYDLSTVGVAFPAIIGVNIQG
jgi:hypothetical protein